MKYRCDKCKKLAKQLNLNREEGQFQCNDCFYKKDEKDDPKSTSRTKDRAPRP